MERDEASRILRSLYEELAEVSKTAQEAARRAAALRKLIDGYEELFPGLSRPDSGAKSVAPEEISEDRPRGQEAVRRVMMESAGKWWTVTTMVRELARRGWMPESDNPPNAVRTSLDRLFASDDNIVKEKGRAGAVAYSFRPFDPVRRVREAFHDHGVRLPTEEAAETARPA